MCWAPWSVRGASLLELMLAVSLMVTGAGMAVPILTSGLADARAGSAAYFLAGKLRLARMEAVKRARTVAVRFEPDRDSYRLTLYQDGNGNGVRAADIDAGVDRKMTDAERLDDRFPGVVFGIAAGVTAVDPPESLDASDPVRIGRSEFLSFTAMGTATPGTLYLLGRGAKQYAVRVLGSTGRTRVLTFNFGERRWIAR